MMLNVDYFDVNEKRKSDEYKNNIKKITKITKKNLDKLNDDWFNIGKMNKKTKMEQYTYLKRNLNKTFNFKQIILNDIYNVNAFDYYKKTLNFIKDNFNNDVIDDKILKHIVKNDILESLNKIWNEFEDRFKILFEKYTLYDIDDIFSKVDIIIWKLDEEKWRELYCSMAKVYVRYDIKKSGDKINNLAEFIKYFLIYEYYKYFESNFNKIINCILGCLYDFLEFYTKHEKIQNEINEDIIKLFIYKDVKKSFIKNEENKECNICYEIPKTYTYRSNCDAKCNYNNLICDSCLIKMNDKPNCAFCNKDLETILHYSIKDIIDLYNH